MKESTLGADIRGTTQASWNQFLAAVDPLRPDLCRFCRKLTGNVWDAEDLIQDTLEQAFARLASLNHDIDSPRAYVLRVASNLWISRLRREQVHARAVEQMRHEDVPSQPQPSEGVAVRTAAERVLAQLAPQEQAAVLLKEVFELSLDEIAGVLGTSLGAVKAALHRGRARLRNTDDTTPPRNAVSRVVLERFVQCFNARDRDGMLALLLDSAGVRMPGVDYEIGRDAFTREPGWLYFNLQSGARWEVAELDGEPVVLHLPKDGEPDVGSVMRFETADDRIGSIRVYAFCPDAVREVAAALDRPAAPLGFYRFTPELFKHIGTDH